ncbi:Tropinone reductase 1 [Symbiodinium microadriaticum]|uniref:Tropinone reductase 1 n=1 Tax=Symbiodinium microadriaticum TaxID=2951 RepID=A0A1Q9DM35_SYMMI|nr:Tropinone reductase 1 [Symbiodinium microadriaticum]
MARTRHGAHSVFLDPNFWLTLAPSCRQSALSPAFAFDISAPPAMTSTSRWSLQGFKAVVTGSTQGLGLAVAKEMLQLGAEVVIMSHKPAEVEVLVAYVEKLWGGSLDGLVNNVGTNVRKPIHEATEGEYYNMMRTNLDSCWFL